MAFERISFALASKVELDGQGRLLLNERLRKRAGLKDQITLVGVRDHIELWNQMSQARHVVLQKQNDEL
ncbi:MAG: MraZ C-terminal domain-containing protein [Planctomycetota bacterium]